jgi:hypothetical protein
VDGVKSQARSLGPCIGPAVDAGEISAGPMEFVLDWTIQADGSVSAAQLKGPEAILKTSLPACFATYMNRWKFPASVSGAPVLGFPMPVTIADKKGGSDQGAVTDQKGDAPASKRVFDFGGKPSDSPIFGGSLPKEVILAVIKDHGKEISACYDRELQAHPTLGGRVKARWLIGSNGRVSQAAVIETSLNNRAIEDCMVEKIKTWQFPEPLGGGVVTVVYPWILSPN